MRDFISRVMVAFAAMLLALAHPRTVEAITSALNAGSPAEHPEAASAAPGTDLRPRSANRVRSYSKDIRAPYVFGSPEWWESHRESKRPQTFVHDGPPYRWQLIA
ncbi:hypothetical protein GCM10027294_46470 [Marinactinospora endophytica]